MTAAYAGLRAAIDHPDNFVDVDDERRYLLVGGIRSTGLTAGMAIAEHVRGLFAEALLDPDPLGGPVTIGLHRHRRQQSVVRA